MGSLNSGLILTINLSVHVYMVNQPLGMKCELYCVHGVDNMFKESYSCTCTGFISTSCRSGAFNGTKSGPAL